MSDGNITSNKSRIPHWSVLAGFSTIALISIMMQFDGKVRDQDGYAKWAVTAICISLIFSYLAAFLSIFFSSSFGGTWIEGGLVSQETIELILSRNPNLICLYCFLRQ